MRIRKYLSTGTHFGGFKPQEEVARLVATADMGFFSLSDEAYAYATPTKFFDYIEAGVPIVASLPQGASRTMVERYGIGLVADVGDAEGLAQCLRQMAEDQSLRDRCRANMRAIRDEFRPEIQVEKWAKMLTGMGLERKGEVAVGAVMSLWR
jgi:glycosyltransferase involved in cell wall biosynthesis